MATIADLIKWAEGRDPNEPIVWYFWTKDDIEERFPQGQTITNEEAKEVLDRFSFPDYVWEGINESWYEEIDAEFGEFRCFDCGEFDKDAQMLNDEKVCRACGEETEVV